MAPAMQKQMFGDHLANVIVEFKAYELSLTAVTAGGLGAKEWVAGNVKQAIADLFHLVNVAEGCHNVLKTR
eukprot:1479211-Heterocapsa_arctica.AAC.1